MNHSKSSTSSITPTYFSSSSSQSKTSSPGNLPTIHYLRQPRNLNGPFRLSRVVAYHIIIIIDTRANFVLRNPIHSVPISTNPCLPHATPKRLYPHTHTHTHTHIQSETARQKPRTRHRHEGGRRGSARLSRSSSGADDDAFKSLSPPFARVRILRFSAKGRSGKGTQTPPLRRRRRRHDQYCVLAAGGKRGRDRLRERERGWRDFERRKWTTRGVCCKSFEGAALRGRRRNGGFGFWLRARDGEMRIENVTVMRAVD